VSRRVYLDWLRGVAVLIMVEAHTLDSWTLAADRARSAYKWAIVVGGFGAPTFLLLAGVALALAIGSRLRKGSSDAEAVRLARRRAWQIVGLAFLFRLQSAVLGAGGLQSLLKVDILNIMGPSILAAAALWGAGRSPRGRLIAFTAATVGLVMLTPIIRAAPLAALPDPIEAYIRPVANLSNFVLFPWAGFTFAGAIVGVLLDLTPTPRESRVNAALFVTGLAISAAALAASYLPSPYASSNFWTTSPCYFFLRAGLMAAAVGAAYAWQSRPGGLAKWSPLRQLGRTSLFIYWIHVEMVYGLISLPLHKALTLPQALIALALFAAFMLICSMAKDRVVEWWRERGSGPTPATAT
jgi:uncharacterized membrane protein